jgi:hypothetical protein
MSIDKIHQHENKHEKENEGILDPSLLSKKRWQILHVLQAAKIIL